MTVNRDPVQLAMFRQKRRRIRPEDIRLQADMRDPINIDLLARALYRLAQEQHAALNADATAIDQAPVDQV